jgi:hypothetical protein
LNGDDALAPACIGGPICLAASLDRCGDTVGLVAHEASATLHILTYLLFALVHQRAHLFGGLL